MAELETLQLCRMGEAPSCDGCPAMIQVELVSAPGRAAPEAVGLDARGVWLCWGEGESGLDVGANATMRIRVSEPAADMRTRVVLERVEEDGDRRLHHFVWAEPKVVFPALPDGCQSRLNRRRSLHLTPQGEVPGVRVYDGNNPRTAEIVDISRDGIALRTRPSRRGVIEVGDALAITLWFEGHAQLEFVVLVRQCRQEAEQLRLGCEFDPVASPGYATAQRLIHGYVDICKAAALRDRRETRTGSPLDRRGIAGRVDWGPRGRRR